MIRALPASALTLALLAGAAATACSSGEPAGPEPAASAAKPADAAPAAQADAVPPAAVPASDSAPAERPKFYRPVKGEATIEVIKGSPKRVGNEMVTVLKIKNTSPGRIDLLRIDEYWYDRDLKDAGGSVERYRKPFNPGDIIEVTMKTPAHPNFYQNAFRFAHTHGSVTPKEVKKFEEAK